MTIQEGRRFATSMILNARMQKHAEKNIIDLQVRLALDAEWASSLKFLVNAEMDASRFAPGDELAVSGCDLSPADAAELLDIFLTENRASTIDRSKLIALVREYLPQSQIANVSWLVADDGSILITDGLRVGRIVKSVMKWVTPRISFDDIDLLSIDYGVIKDSAYWIGSFKPDSPFRIDFESGSILKGQIVED